MDKEISRSLYSSFFYVYIRPLPIGSLPQAKPATSSVEEAFLEAIWIREEGCKEVVESAWDPLRGDPEIKIMDRLKSYQKHLKRWNWKVFGNINNVLKQKQGKLQLLEATECDHDNAEEIRKLKLEIN